MPGIVAGDSRKLTVGTDPSKVSTLIGGGQRGPRRRAWRVILYCPDGTDPGIASNTDTVYAGPAGSGGFPIRPGASVTFTNVDPWDISMVCATANQLCYITWGGEAPGANE